MPKHIAAQHPFLEPVLTDSAIAHLDLWLVGRPEVRTTGYLRHAFSTVGDTLNDILSRMPGHSEEVALV